MKTKKLTIKRDVPAKLFNMFAAYLAEPLTDIINCSIATRQYPVIWKDRPKKHKWTFKL